MAKDSNRMRWARVQVVTADGCHEAIAPEVISVSRSTDIPAFHAEWFVNRLRAGYVKWVNPFNREPQYVSFENVKAAVLWSKNPEPIIQYLPELDSRNIAYYFHFTLNDYEAEGFEPNVPPIADRLRTFRHLSEMLGREKVIWRFDPLILTDRLDSDQLLRRLTRVGNEVHELTTRLVFSFADVAGYAKVQRNLRKAGVNYREFSVADMHELASGISSLCSKWDIEPMACGESVDLSQFGIARSRCVDDCLLLKITRRDCRLLKLFGYPEAGQLELLIPDSCARPHAKDPGQRSECDCVLSKDIGQYDTCPHLCVYCYANASPGLVKRNLEGRQVDAESIVTERPRRDSTPSG